MKISGKRSLEITARLKQGLFVPLVLMLAVAIPFLNPRQAHAVQTLNEYTIPTSASTSMGMVTGPDGAQWFTEETGNKIGQITTTGVITEYSLPNAASYPRDITVGSDGALWFTEVGFNKIGRITTSGTITEYGPLQGEPQNITLGPDGNVWFAEWDGYIGKMTPAGALTEYNVRTAGNSPMPRDITTGPDGALWFTEQIGKIGRITTTGTVTHYPISQPEIASPYTITTGPDGALWWGNLYGAIGRMTTSGSMTAYQGESSIPQISGITSGPDGALWFTSSNSKIGRLTTSGDITLYPITPLSNPYGIAVGADSALWFTERSGNRIGRLEVAPPAAPANLTAASPTKDVPHLSWDIATGATSYNVYRDGVVVGNVATPGFTDAVLAEGTYAYQVTAVDADGESAFSNTATVIVDKTRPTLSFTSPSSFSQVFTPGPLVTIQAADANGLSSMAIHVYTSANMLLANCGNATPAERAAGVMSCDLSGLPSGTYYVKAGTFDSAGNNRTINSGNFVISN